MTTHDSFQTNTSTPEQPVEVLHEIESIPMDSNIIPEEYNPTLRENLWVHPSRVWLRSTRIGQPAHNLAEAVLDDMEDRSWKIKTATVALGATAITTQGLDRVRIVIQKAPPEAIEKMVSMQFSKPSSLVAAGIVAGAFGIWNFVNGEILNRTIEQFPNLTNKFVDQFPRVTKAAQNAIPNNSEPMIDEDAGLLKKTAHAVIPHNRSGAWSRIKRGGSGVLLGSTIFVGTAASKDIPVKERTTINAKVTRDASAILFGFTYGVAETVRRTVLSGNPERAQRIIENAGSAQNWNRASIVLIAATIGLNSLARKSVEEDVTEDIPFDSPNK